MTVSLRIPPETLKQKHERDDMPHTCMDDGDGSALKPSKHCTPADLSCTPKGHGGTDVSMKRP